MFKNIVDMKPAASQDYWSIILCTYNITNTYNMIKRFGVLFCKTKKLNDDQQIYTISYYF